MHRRACLLLLLLAAACGSETADNVDPAGSAEFWIKASVPATSSKTGASFSLDASFIRPGATSCATTTIGACTIDPCFSPVSSRAGSDVTDVGQVTLVSSTATGAIEPQSDGTYATRTFVGVPWMTGGDSLTLGWTHFPGSTSQAGGTLALETPPYVTLSSGSPFADPTSTLARTGDLTFSWTSDSPPASADNVSVYLVSGSTQVGCNFDASAGTGVVPAAALQSLDAGAGTFDVHSKRFTGQHMAAADGSTWAFGFNVDAIARTSDGLALGTVTFR
jgi:hypothetical protein